MRDLKFRVWDKITKQLIYLNKVNFVNYEIDGKNTGFELTLDGIGDENKKKKWLRAEKDYIIQQFTGLKDKIGIEIYEGDILNIECLNGKTVNYLVNFYDGAFNLSKMIYLTVANIELNQIKIIGNLFEDPNLLI